MMPAFKIKSFVFTSIYAFHDRVLCLLLTYLFTFLQIIKINTKKRQYNGDKQIDAPHKRAFDTNQTQCV